MDGGEDNEIPSLYEGLLGTGATWGATITFLQECGPWEAAHASVDYSSVIHIQLELNELNGRK